MTDRTILIVEDHTMIAEYIASIVAAEGFEPIQARSLNEARALLSMRSFDLWLCDRHLPDGDSVALLAERASDRHMQSPAIALTAEMTAADREALLAAGFVDALAKPFTAEDLRAAIRRALTLPAHSVPDPSQRSASAAASDSPRVLDDEAALRICGDDRASLSAMRRLMAGDLSRLRERIRMACGAGHTAELLGELHQLAASSAWCGAAELAACGRALGAAVTTGHATAIDVAAGDIDEAFSRLALALRQER